MQCQWQGWKVHGGAGGAGGQRGGGSTHCQERRSMETHHHKSRFAFGIRDRGVPIRCGVYATVGAKDLITYNTVLLSAVSLQSSLAHAHRDPTHLRWTVLLAGPGDWCAQKSETERVHHPPDEETIVS